MKESFILMVLPAAAVLVVLLLKDRFSGVFRRRRSPPEEIGAYDTSLLNPDWAFYERHLQRPAPAALRELYSDAALISACESYSGRKRAGISSFLPLNEDSLIDTHDELGHDIVPIANSDCGDPIYLKPGAKESNVVYIAYHDDPGNVEVFAESVAEMVEKARNRVS
jgi:hypothetical protein